MKTTAGILERIVLDPSIYFFSRFLSAFLLVQAILVLIEAACGTAPGFTDVCVLIVVAFSAPLTAADTVRDFRRFLER